MKEKNSKQITFGTYAVIVTIVFLVLLVGILAVVLIQNNKVEEVTSTSGNIVTENKTDTENVQKEEDIVTNNKTTNKDNKNNENKKPEENNLSDDEVKNTMKDKAEELIEQTEDEVVEKVKKAKRAVYETEAREELLLLSNDVMITNIMSENGYTGYINKDTLEYTKKNKGMKAKEFYESKLKEKGYIVEVAVDSEGHPTISHIEYEED